MPELRRSLALFHPEIVLCVGLLLVVVVDSIGAAWRNAAMRVLTLAALALAFGLAFDLQASGAKAALFSGMLVVDPLAAAFKVVLVGAGLLTVLAFTFRNSRELHGLGQGEFFALVLALVLSCLLLAAANDIVMLYLALEMVSITSYVMVAYLKGDRQRETWQAIEVDLGRSILRVYRLEPERARLDATTASGYHALGYNYQELY